MNPTLPAVPALDVRRMRVLREVAAQGSITGAADALNFTPSAVSQQVRLLERQAGLALIERGTRIELTEAGRTLVSHADFILARIEDAEAEILSIAGLGGGRLRIATFRSASELIAEAVTYFRHRFPVLQVSLFEGEPEEYLNLIKINEIDLALSFEYDYVPVSRDDSLERAPLLSEPILIALPSSHRLATRDQVSLSDLADDRWIAPPRHVTAHQFAQRACAEAGFRPEITFETNDYHVAQSLVATGLGVTLLPHLASYRLHDGVVVRPICSHPQRKVYAVHRPGGQRAPAVHAMLDALRSLAQDSDC